MRTLVTGSGGIIGSHLCRQLATESETQEIVAFRGDLTDEMATRNFVHAAGPIDRVIHLAAVVAVENVRSSPERAYAVNVGGTLNLLTALIDAGCSPHIFHCSSAHVYSPAKSALREDDATVPISLYGRTKLMSEVVARDICEIHGLPLCIGRVFSIHDPAQVGSYLLPRILGRLEKEDLAAPFDLPGADSIRDFLPAERASMLIMALSTAEHRGIVNIGSGRPTRIRDFVQALAQRPLSINPVGDSDCLLADITRLNGVLDDQRS